MKLEYIFCACKNFLSQNSNLHPQIFWGFIWSLEKQGGIIRNCATVNILLLSYRRCWADAGFIWFLEKQDGLIWSCVIVSFLLVNYRRCWLEAGLIGWLIFFFLCRLGWDGPRQPWLQVLGRLVCLLLLLDLFPGKKPHL